MVIINVLAYIKKFILNKHFMFILIQIVNINMKKKSRIFSFFSNIETSLITTNFSQDALITGNLFQVKYVRFFLLLLFSSYGTSFI